MELYSIIHCYDACWNLGAESITAQPSRVCGRYAGGIQGAKVGGGAGKDAGGGGEGAVGGEGGVRKGYGRDAGIVFKVCEI